MKTLNELKSQEASLLSDIEFLKLVPKGEVSKDRKARVGKLRRVRKNLGFVRHIMAYIKTNPSEDFVRAEIDRLNKRLKSINGGYAHRRRLITKELTLTQEKDMKAEYDKELGVPKINLQIKTLKFILG